MIKRKRMKLVDGKSQMEIGKFGFCCPEWATRPGRSPRMSLTRYAPLAWILFALEQEARIRKPEHMSPHEDSL